MRRRRDGLSEIRFAPTWVTLALLTMLVGCAGALTAPTTPTDDDADHDGVLTSADRCPNEAEDVDGVDDADGCPDPDSDGDSIVDAEDACPSEAEVVDQYIDSDGCPDPDNDGDRILDVDDACPCEPEVYNGVSDDDGCHDCGRVLLMGMQLRILEKVYFARGSAVVLARDFPIVDAIAATMIANAFLLRVEVAGHASADEPHARARALSEARATAVLEMHVARGVERGVRPAFVQARDARAELWRAELSRVLRPQHLERVRPRVA